MKKILFFPLLNSMPSGHHQVAEALCEIASATGKNIECKKLDLLSEWNRHIEYAAVKTYLKWIRYSPDSYAWMYRQFAYNAQKPPHVIHYELLFKKKAEAIIGEENPDLIVCTHGFPSLIMNKLKMEGKCSTPCLNVYTDFFINKVWGISHIDYHFVAHAGIKKQLHEMEGVPSSRIFITGIPVSGKFEQGKTGKPTHHQFNILLAGGSIGLGNILDLLDNGKGQTECQYKILCGTNKSLFEKVQNSTSGLATPFPYISSKDEMDRLYSTSNALVTKPGGVTISEALRKELPIFVHSALPGQEEINLKFLMEKGLVFQIPQHSSMSEYVMKTLADDKKMEAYRQAVKDYKESLQLASSEELFDCIEQFMEAG